jgi:hypothetical protein
MQKGKRKQRKESQREKKSKKAIMIVVNRNRATSFCCKLFSSFTAIYLYEDKAIYNV